MHRLVLITKGDLVHQTRKVTTSGIAHHFEHVEIVLEKDAETYAQAAAPSSASRPTGSAWSATRCAATSCRCWRSAATPCTSRTTCTWELEHVDDHDEDVAELASIAELPAWLGLRG